jgi:hypothetical protein
MFIFLSRIKAAFLYESHERRVGEEERIDPLAVVDRELLHNAIRMPFWRQIP